MIANDFDTPAGCMFKYILNRLTERSTWLGVIGLITACGALLETELAEQIIAAGLGWGNFFGFWGFFA